MTPFSNRIPYEDRDYLYAAGKEAEANAIGLQPPILFKNKHGKEFEVWGEWIQCQSCGFQWASMHRAEDDAEEYCGVCREVQLEKFIKALLRCPAIRAMGVIDPPPFNGRSADALLAIVKEGDLP